MHVASFPSSGKRYQNLRVCLRTRVGLCDLYSVSRSEHSSKGCIVISAQLHEFRRRPLELPCYAHASTTIARSRINIRLRPKPRILSHLCPPLPAPSPFSTHRRASIRSGNATTLLPLPSRKIQRISPVRPPRSYMYVCDGAYRRRRVPASEE